MCECLTVVQLIMCMPSHAWTIGFRDTEWDQWYTWWLGKERCACHWGIQPVLKIAAWEACTSHWPWVLESTEDEGWADFHLDYDWYDRGWRFVVAPQCCPRPNSLLAGVPKVGHALTLADPYVDHELFRVANHVLEGLCAQKSL
jgi:hypothetical protein